MARPNPWLSNGRGAAMTWAASKRMQTKASSSNGTNKRAQAHGIVPSKCDMTYKAGHTCAYHQAMYVWAGAPLIRSSWTSRPVPFRPHAPGSLPNTSNRVNNCPHPAAYLAGPQRAKSGVQKWPPFSGHRYCFKQQNPRFGGPFWLPLFVRVRPPILNTCC